MNGLWKRGAAMGLAGAVLALPAAGGAQGDRNPSPYETRSSDVAAVSKVRIEGPFKVFILAGSDEDRVDLFGPSELLADASARIVDDVLVIAFREGATWSWNPGSGMHANVRLKALDALEVEGPAMVEALMLPARQQGEPDDFTATLDGAGQVEISGLDASGVMFAVGGSGTIEAAGSADTVAYALGGAGRIEAKRLRARTGTIALGGAGKVYADIAESADVKVGGSGSVEIVGGATCTTRAPRPEQVECR